MAAERAQMKEWAEQNARLSPDRGIGSIDNIEEVGKRTPGNNPMSKPEPHVNVHSDNMRAGLKAWHERQDENPVPNRATPRFDPADPTGQAQQDARVYPEVIEKLVAEIINGSSSVREALYCAYLCGVRSERASQISRLEASKLYEERMEK